MSEGSPVQGRDCLRNHSIEMTDSELQLAKGPAKTDSTKEKTGTVHDHSGLNQMNKVFNTHTYSQSLTSH